MFVDARTLPDGSLIEVDVCIVGAGAAGITIARELRGRRLRVGLLESGWLTPDDVTQSLYAGSAPAQPYFALETTRTRCFGGTTNQWTGECRPLDALDFEERPWVPESGWPFDFGHLRPFYERAQAVCQLGPFAYVGTDWMAQGVQPLVFSGGRLRSTTIHYSPPTRFGETYRKEIDGATNIVVYLGANVIGLETPTPPNHVSAARVACLSGSRFRVSARIFILAMGGIENARLLLLANTVQSAGLGNGYDQVGRHFMEHLYLDRAAAIVDRRGVIGDFYTLGHHANGRRVRGILELSPEVQRRERLTSYCAVLDEDSPWTLPASWSPLLSVIRRVRVPAHAWTRLQATVARIGRAVVRLKGAHRDPSVRRYFVKNVMEQAPNPESRVVLGTDKDRLGCPRVVLHWRLTALDKRTVHRAHEILAEDVARVGIESFRSALGSPDDPWPPTLRGARHHMGTTRMHPSPRRGVVDANGLVHGIANLYVAGSSVFPTSGSANPTLTIVGSSRVDLQACKLEYSIVSPK